MDDAIDRILDDGYLGGVDARPVEELRTLRGECQAVETKLSYLRRLVQGQHDIVTGEIARRAGGGDPSDVSDLVDRLPEILADRIHAPGPGRLPVGMEPGELSGRLIERLTELSTQVPLEELGSVDDAHLGVAAEDLAALEQEISTLRRAMFDRIDALQGEITDRYRDGRASVDELLTSDD
jgi:hypothetical protein